MNGFKINVEGVSETSASLQGRNASFGDSVATLYNTMNTAKENAWQGTDADLYYDRIVAYKAKLEKISEDIRYWEQKTSNIAENFRTASANINSSINNLN